jgi:orotidine-5'-phosphate decarboxylase
MTTRNFADRLTAACREKRSAVCVGIDPRVKLLPSEFKPRRDTPNEHAQAIADWARELVAVVAPIAPVVKPQIAFYEALGAPGFRAYHETVLAAQEKGLLVIADVKRGDIGSTAEAYAEGHFGMIGADAITVSPFLGRDSLEPYLAHCRAAGKGIFVLVKTSNPGSADVQDLRSGDATISRHVAKMVREIGADPSIVGECGLSSVGAVTGGTFPEEIRELRAAMPTTPLLVPGYGAQGASAADCAKAFLPDGTGAIVNSSRGITFAFRSGDHAERFGDKRWRDSVAAAVYEMSDALAAATGMPRAT